MIEKVEKLAVKSNIKENKTMRKYLALTLAFILGLSMSASAVVLDEYKVIVLENSDGEVTSTTDTDPGDDKYDAMEDGTYNGDWIEQEHVSSVDTSNFSTFDEYKNLIENVFISEEGSNPHRGHFLNYGNTYGAEEYNDVLQEMQDRGIATSTEIASWLIDNIKGVCRITDSNDNTTEDISLVSNSITALENIDPQAVDLSTLDIHYLPRLAMVAGAIYEEGGSRAAFDNIWAVMEREYGNSDRYTVEYAVYHDALLGNSQQAHADLLEVAQNDKYQSFILSAVIGVPWLISNSDIPTTEDILWEIVTPVDEEFLNSSIIIERLITLWNHIPWYEYSSDEVKQISDKYNMTIPTNDITSPFKAAVKQKKQDLE